MAPVALPERGTVAGARVSAPHAGGTRRRPSTARNWFDELRFANRVVALEDLAPPEAVEALVVRTVREISSVYGDAAIAIEKIDMSRVRPLARVMNARRRDRMERYLRMLRRRHIIPYTPAAVRFRGEAAYQLALPPVLEEHGSQFAVVDGLHRLHLLFERGDSAVVCVVIRGAHLPELPSDLARWRAVRVSTNESRPQKKNFLHFRSSRFRPVGSYLRSELFQYPDLQAIADACVAALRSGGSVVSEHWCKEHGRLDDCPA